MKIKKFKVLYEPIKELNKTLQMLKKIINSRNNEVKNIITKTIENKDISLKDLSKVVVFLLGVIIPSKDIDYTIKIVKEKKTRIYS